MRRLVSACVAVLAIGTLPASAADVPLRYPAKGPPLIAPIGPTWTGCFLGFNVGGGWAHKQYNDPILGLDLESNHVTGVVGGGQIGCDYQVGVVVVGVQGMFNGAHLEGRHFVNPIFNFIETKIPWYATATARVGFAVNPYLLAYVRGGVAWVKDEEAIVNSALAFVQASADVTRTGWTVGAGLEYRFTADWSIFVEYNYLDFGTDRIALSGLVPAALDISQHVQTVTAGVNFRYNWGPIYARY